MDICEFFDDMDICLDFADIKEKHPEMSYADIKHHVDAIRAVLEKESAQEPKPPLNLFRFE